MVVKTSLVLPEDFLVLLGLGCPGLFFQKTGAHPQQPKNTQIKLATVAIDDMAGNNACVEVLFEANFRQPRADPLEFGQ